MSLPNFIPQDLVRAFERAAELASLRMQRAAATAGEDKGRLPKASIFSVVTSIQVCVRTLYKCRVLLVAVLKIRRKAITRCGWDICHGCPGQWGGWPPRDCLSADEADWLPENWWHQEQIGKSVDQLKALQLPALHITEDFGREAYLPTPHIPPVEHLQCMQCMVFCLFLKERSPLSQSLKLAHKDVHEQHSHQGKLSGLLSSDLMRIHSLDFINKILGCLNIMPFYEENIFLCQTFHPVVRCGSNQ